MVLIHNFKSTTRWKAFILNSFAASLSIVVALMVKSYFDVYTDDKGNIITVRIKYFYYLITFLITFIATFSSYFLLYLFFGYGGGQLTQS